MVVPFKSTPCFQQDAIQQRTVPTLSKMSLNLTSKRKVWLMMTGYFLLLKPHQPMKLLWNSFFHHLFHPNPSTFDSLRTIHGGLTKHGLLWTVKELRSIIFFKIHVYRGHHFTTLPFWEACFSVFPWYSNPTADWKRNTNACVIKS